MFKITAILLIVANFHAKTIINEEIQCNLDQNTFWFENGCWPMAPNTIKNHNGTITCGGNARLIRGNCVDTSSSQGSSINFVSQSCRDKECRTMFAIFGIPTDCPNSILSSLIKFEEVKQSGKSRSIWGYVVYVRKIPFGIICTLKFNLN